MGEQLSIVGAGVESLLEIHLQHVDMDQKLTSFRLDAVFRMFV